MAKNFIQKAIKNPGGLHKALGIPTDKRIPAAKLEKATESNNEHVRKMANFAKTLAKIRNK